MDLLAPGGGYCFCGGYLGAIDDPEVERKNKIVLDEVETYGRYVLQEVEKARRKT